MELRDKRGLTEQEFLRRYRPKEQPRPSVTADIVPLSKGASHWRVLLIRRGGHPYLGCWALPGGAGIPGETIDETAARELYAETRLTGLQLQQLGLFSNPDRDPRGWTISQAYLAVVDEERVRMRRGSETAQADWFQVETHRVGDRLELRLEGAGETIRTCVELQYAMGHNGPTRSFHQNGRGPLAFDHAEMLACALDRMGLIQ